MHVEDFVAKTLRITEDVRHYNVTEHNNVI